MLGTMLHFSDMANEAAANGVSAESIMAMRSGEAALQDEGDKGGRDREAEQGDRLRDRLPVQEADVGAGSG